MYSVPNSLFLVFLSLFFCFSPKIASAERELHYVSIYDGSTKTGDQIHGPKALVRLDRAGADVTLVLSSQASVRWYVETVNETKIETLVLAGRGGGKSEVFVDGQRFVDAIFRNDLPGARRPEGPGFRKLIGLLPTLGGFERLDSFTNKPQAADGTLIVSERFPDDANLGSDHLRAHVLGPGILSAPLRAAMESQSLDIRPATRFSNKGLHLQHPDGTWKDFPAGLDVPHVSHPKGSAFVASENAIYGVSLGGEGYLYRVDTSNGVWSVVQSMDGFDANGMVYDQAGHRLIMLGRGGSSLGRLMLFGLNTRASRIHDLPIGHFVGLLDLGRPGIPGRSALELIGIDGDTFLFRAIREVKQQNPDAPQFRVWSFDLNTGDVRLIAYADPPM